MRKVKRHALFKRFVEDVSVHTPFNRMLVTLVVLWLAFSAVVYLAERAVGSSRIDSYGEALYWGVAAFTTAGIADMPASGTARLVGGLWMVVGSVLFFGTIVATITTYFNKPMQRPHRKIIDTIEFNLEQLEDLSVEELDLLKETVDTLIVHVEHLKQKRRGS